jgi:hypothetical protein
MARASITDRFAKASYPKVNDSRFGKSLSYCQANHREPSLAIKNSWKKLEERLLASASEKTTM